MEAYENLCETPVRAMKHQSPERARGKWSTARGGDSDIRARAGLSLRGSAGEKIYFLVYLKRGVKREAARKNPHARLNVTPPRARAEGHQLRVGGIVLPARARSNYCAGARENNSCSWFF